MTWKKVGTYIEGDVLHENKTTAMPHSRDFSHTSEWSNKRKKFDEAVEYTFRIHNKLSSP
jgi:hypothetical protein